jgi:type IV pilus assembly protein PilV
MMTHSQRSRERGASLIEVLVAILILAFGILALGGMLAYSVQLPKLAAMRATAVMLASAHVEKMRANRTGFANNTYLENSTFNLPLTPVVACAYPTCDANSLATADLYQSSLAIRNALPQGGIRVTCQGACSTQEGDLWVMWQEPGSASALNAAWSDECPDLPFVAPFPRCVHIRFKL